MFHQYILIYNNSKGDNEHWRLKLLHWGLKYTKSRIVLDSKKAFLILHLFNLFIMILIEELLGKVMNVLGD